MRRPSPRCDRRSPVERSPVVFDPYCEAAAYLQAMADGQVFDRRRPPTANLAGKTIEEILRIAIELEKDSIVFYRGLREMVPENLGREKVERILKEEMGHVTLLADELAALAR